MHSQTHTSPQHASQHVCAGGAACFVCGCTECGYSVDLHRLVEVTRAHFPKNPSEPAVAMTTTTTTTPSGNAPTRGDIARLTGLVQRVLSCRTCGRATHCLCALHPLEPRPWLPPWVVPASERQAGLRALQSVLHSIHTHNTQVNAAMKDADNKIKQEAPDNDGQDEWGSRGGESAENDDGDGDGDGDGEALSLARFPSSPMPSSTSADVLGSVTVPLASAVASSPPARPPRSPPPLPSDASTQRAGDVIATTTAVKPTTATTTSGGGGRRGPKRRGGSTAAASPSATTASGTAGLAKSESPGTTEPYFCSLDCALQLELRPNPFFDPEMSQRYEHEAAQRLRESEPFRLTQQVMAAMPALTRSQPHKQESDHNRSAEKKRKRSGKDTLGSSNDDTADDDDADAVAAREAAPAVLQVRYEAWLKYFAEDSVVHGRFPPFFPPCFVDADERVLAAVARLLTPAGQAQRLCGLDPEKHPVGSLLAVPEGGLWDDLKLVEPRTSTSFIAEQLQLFLNTAVTPVDVTRKRPRETLASGPTSTPVTVSPSSFASGAKEARKQGLGRGGAGGEQTKSKAKHLP